jgi:hypothetical protein
MFLLYCLVFGLTVVALIPLKVKEAARNERDKELARRARVEHNATRDPLDFDITY